MLKLDKKTVAEFEKTWISKLKVFFIEAWCSGTKIDMNIDFELSDDIDRLESDYGFDLYVPKTDRKYLENSRITRVFVADHTGQVKMRYIFTSEDVEDKCGCGTSFAFEKPVPKIDLEKLRLLRMNFKNKSL